MADLAKIGKLAAKIGMRVAGTAKVSATLHLGKTNTFNAATDTMVASAGTDVPLLGVKYELKQEKGVTNKWATEFLLENADIPAGVNVDVKDNLVIAGEKWEIANVERIPTEAIVILGLKK